MKLKARPGGLMHVACYAVSRSDVAFDAVRMWKECPAVRKAHGSVGELYERLCKIDRRVEPEKTQTKEEGNR